MEKTFNPQIGKPATSRLLMTELFSFISETVRNYPFPSPDGKALDCRVFLHGLPEKQDSGTYPFIVVRWIDGRIEAEDDGKTVLNDTTGLFLGVYSPRSQEEAGLLTADLLDVLRRAIWKKRLLAHRFELVEPLKASVPVENQMVHQFHMATIEAMWNYVWPPKAFEEAGQSQIKNGSIGVDSYSAPELGKYDIL